MAVPNFRKQTLSFSHLIKNTGNCDLSHKLKEQLIKNLLCSYSIESRTLEQFQEFHYICTVINDI